MLECNVIWTPFAHYICLHGYIHFIYLFNPKYRYMYRIPQISHKYRVMNFGHIAQPYFEEMCIW